MKKRRVCGCSHHILEGLGTIESADSNRRYRIEEKGKERLCRADSVLSLHKVTDSVPK